MSQLVWVTVVFEWYYTVFVTEFSKRVDLSEKILAWFLDDALSLKILKIKKWTMETAKENYGSFIF